MTGKLKRVDGKIVDDQMNSSNGTNVGDCSNGMAFEALDWGHRTDNGSNNHGININKFDNHKGNDKIIDE